MSYEEQRLQSDIYLPAAARIIRNITGSTGITVGTHEEDRDFGADLVLRTDHKEAWGLRVREPSCRWRDFTVRAKSNLGDYTELDKMLDGNYPDRYLYGWGDGRGNLTDWVAVDTKKVVATIEDDMLDHCSMWSKRTNPDGSEFVATPASNLRSAVIAHSGFLDDPF